MNSEEQTLIDGLFTRLQQAEAGSAPRDALAQARINEHLARQPAASYYMTQALLVQEAALKQLDQQNKQLQAELAQARATPAAAPTGGSFLSGLFGGGDRAPAAAPAASPLRAPAAGVMARWQRLRKPHQPRNQRQLQRWVAAFWVAPSKRLQAWRVA